jgi:myo-inositol-1-phosphate synthase
MVVGLGAVATTMIAGVEAVRRGLAKPIGSLTQMGTIRLGKRTDNNSPLIKDFVPLADLNDIVFTGWDIFEDNVYEPPRTPRCWTRKRSSKLKPYLETIKPMPAVFDQYYVKRLHGTHVKKGKNKRDLADQVIADIRAFKKTVDRVVMIWCGSTEIFLEPTAVHQSIEAFEKGLETNDIGIAPRRSTPTRRSSEGVPFANGAPNLTVDVPAHDRALEEERRAHLRQGLQDRPDLHEDRPGAGLQGAHAGRLRLVLHQHPRQPRRRSARRSRVLQDQGRVEARLARIHLPARALPRSLQGHLPQDSHQLLSAARRRQRGLGQHRHLRLAGLPMQIKVNFLCRDSILAAPIALDLVLFLDLAKRTPELRSIGIQEWLSFYLKSPQTRPASIPSTICSSSR